MEAFSSHRSQNQNRGRLAFGPNRAQHFAAAHAGQHQVENDEVIIGLLTQFNPVAAIPRHVDGHARALAQSLRDVVRDPGLVFDDQHAHGS